MFIHLGGDVIIPKKDIVAIISAQACRSAATAEFLGLARSEKKLELIGERGKEKSFVLTREKVFLSPISCATLKKRAEAETWGELARLVGKVIIVAGNR
ncbi:extracellular matrix regulator RemB [Desulfovirgula thermocuniculi]|uniref:extracellular matrix regulator RemB n=1 Tax=Desulfovirgula thermocuniculi TaxID=348842 RepID=UPI000423054E|nr:extracellular matrix/biofilm biosynthesis regulator RemA family protein [Desulfovirgula thermocuniculi]